MSRRSLKRISAVLLLVAVCSLAVPAPASAYAPSMDNIFMPAAKLWARAMDWLRHTCRPGTGSQYPPSAKFGAGHSSDGRVTAVPSS